MREGKVLEPDATRESLLTGRGPAHREANPRARNPDCCRVRLEENLDVYCQFQEFNLEKRAQTLGDLNIQRTRANGVGDNLCLSRGGKEVMRVRERACPDIQESSRISRAMK